MAQVTYIDPIATLSGKIVKRHKTIYLVRQAATANPVMLENPCFTTSLSKRRTELTEAEQEHRTRFGAVCKATAARLQDPSQSRTDAIAFKAQQEYTTLRQYVWHQVEKDIS